MNVVIVPADQAEMLLPGSFRLSSENYPGPHVFGRHPPAKDIVIHDQEVTGNVTLAVECETYGTTHIGGPKHGTGRCEWEPPCEGGHRPFATATVAECLPIVDQFDWQDDARDVALVDDENGRVWFWPVEGRLVDRVDITDHIVGTPEPGLWALILTDVVKS